ncbi:MAG: hypothetical protein SH868_10125 [Bythopirellula sp.]|nr:hypothetical protein [Bythopirellula sp.]
MLATLLSLLVFVLSSQLGERYPTDDPSGTGSPSSTESAVESPIDTETTEKQAEADTEEPANENFFDSLEKAAQPLTPPETPPLETGTTSESQPQTTAPRTDTTAPESETDPAKLLASFLEAPQENPLKGTPLTLAEAITNSLSRPEQTQRVVAYWELSQAVTNYYLTTKEGTELAALAQGITQPSPEWEIARQATAARLELARERVRVAQEYLTQVMANTTVGFMPLPSDVPFCGPYETRYAEIFQGPPSPLAQQLNELLPRAFQDLGTRTQEIADARKWMFKVSDTRAPQTDGNELLKAYELFAARRRMYVEAVKQYNLGIVRYTEIATPGTLETERLVGMLIRTGGSQGKTFDTDVQKANVEESINDSSSLPATGPGVTDWQPAPTNSRERSILVPRG